MMMSHSTDDGLGPELALDYLNLANWGGTGATVSIVDDSVKIVANDGASDRGEFDVVGLTVSTSYRVKIVAKSGIGTAQRFGVWTFATIDTIAIPNTEYEEFVIDLVATATSGLMRCYAALSGGSIGDELFIKSISIKEIL